MDKNKFPKLMSIYEFSEFLELSKSALYKAIEEGRICDSIVEENGVKKIEVISGILEWYKNTRATKSNPRNIRAFKSAENIPDVNESEQYIKYFQAKSYERKDLEEEKKIVPLEEAYTGVLGVFKLVREQLLTIGFKVSGEITKDQSKSEIARLITGEIESVLEKMSAEQISFLRGMDAPGD